MHTDLIYVTSCNRHLSRNAAAEMTARNSRPYASKFPRITLFAELDCLWRIAP